MQQHGREWPELVLEHGPDDLASRLAAIRRRQLPDLEKRRRADFVIPTGLDRRQSVRAIARIIDGVRGRPGVRWPRAWPA